jgi:signal transduction histidine kinase
LIVKACEKPPIVNADGAKTFRVIENLLSNARKYSAKASRVYVDVYSNDDFGIFEIKNISAQPLDISADELTERFVRGDKSRNQEGNGLGLSIAKELCKIQNGKLEIIIDGDLFKARVMLPLVK